MKKIANLTMAFVLIVWVAGAQIQTPQPSPQGSVYSKVGLTDVTIEYFRPKVKGRKVFGTSNEHMHKYGELWRTGANSGSKLTVSTDAKIAGQDVKAGTYLILTKPGQDEWELILYSDLSIGGNMSKFKEENVVLSTKVKVTKPLQQVEALSFQISDISEDNTSANIEFAWENVTFKVPLVVDYTQAVERQIAGAYTAIANYYLQKGIELETALSFMDTYLAIDNNSEQFWHLHTKAKILVALGKNKEAIATAKDSIEKAKNNKAGDFGYIQRNQNLINSLQ